MAFTYLILLFYGVVVLVYKIKRMHSGLPSPVIFYIQKGIHGPFCISLEGRLGVA